MQLSPPLSAFATALASLLDDTHFFSRAEWAAMLRVPLASLDEWTSDRRFPRADLLRIVLDTLEGRSDIPPEPIVAFRAMARRPAKEVSPFGDEMGATVEAYMKERFSEFGARMRDAPSPAALQRLLRTGSLGGAEPDAD